MSMPSVIIGTEPAFTPMAPCPEDAVSPGNGSYPYDGGPSAPGPGDGGTYPYDGGPANPVPQIRPMPKANPAAAPVPTRPSVPLEGRSVSLPSSSSAALYAAYGATPRRAGDSARVSVTRR
jgi:hypothetical protein